MRNAIILIVGLVSIFAIWFAMQSQPSNSSDDVLAMMRDTVRNMSDAEVRLERCQFSMRQQNDGTQGVITQFQAFDVDLELFEFKSVRVADMEDGAAHMVIARKDASELLFAQVRKVLNVFPEERQPRDPNTADREDSDHADVPRDAAGAISFEAVREALLKPRGQVVFDFSAHLPDGALESSAPLPQHKDAPEFFAFSEAVLAIDPPRTFSVQQVFQGVDRQAETFLAGRVEIPAELHIVLATREAAYNLGAALFQYTQRVCPT